VGTEPLGLYVHVPFCASICGYCHFTRGVSDPALERRYVAAVVREIGAPTACLTPRAALPKPLVAQPARGRRARTGSARRATGEVRRAEPGADEPVRDRRLDGRTAMMRLTPRAASDADTIYFGGGTPSLLAPADIAAVIRACREAFDVSPGAEVTLEANPDTVTESRLAGYRSAGVNRLSFGVQSFRDQDLARLGRRHDAARAQAAFREARAAGFDNISVDLMLGLPGQARADARASVEGLIALEPEHASVYLLELHPGTPLGDAVAQGGVPQPDEDEAADMYLETMAGLESAGLEQYEISNVARPGRRSRHNLKYWTDGEWLGFGCGAHSTVGAERWNNTESIPEYISRIERGASPESARRKLSRREQLEEALFMALRLADGVSFDRVRARYGVDVWQEWGGRLAPFEGEGLLERDDRRLRLTREGMLLASSVMITFLEAGSTVK
jgi:oxygen-independent coproporphyrinogen III oxidase